jgi:hypothetical protein
MKDEPEDATLHRTDAEVEELVRRFESGQLSPDDFNHRAHLTVALLYSLRLPEAEAQARMRSGILNFLARHGLDSGIYHETITLFWMRRVHALTVGAAHPGTLCGLANELMRTCGDPRLIHAYYSRELLDSHAARSVWTEPDLRPLDF